MEKLWLIHSLHKMQMKAQCKKSIAKSESSSLNGPQQRDPRLPQEIQEESKRPTSQTKKPARPQTATNNKASIPKKTPISSTSNNNGDLNDIITTREQIEE